MKLTRVIPAHTKVIEFYAVKRDFSTFGEAWRNGRSRRSNPLDKCEWCHAPFKDGDMIALGFSNHRKNMVLCQTCANFTRPATKEARDA